MRSAIVAAAFAAGALAVPLMERDVVYETDVVYATAYVTVTAGDSAPTDAPAPIPSSSSVSVKQNHWGHRKPKSSSTQEAQGYAWTSSWATTWTESAPAATSVQEQAPAYSSVQEQAPAPSSYEAPQSSYESTPTTSEAAPSSAPASSAAPDTDAKPTDYASIVEYHHNVHRYNHSSPAMAWNESLAATAEKIGKLCSYEHMMTMDNGGYGQNIAAGVKGDNVSAVITELFYNGEERAYADAGNYGKGGEDENDGFNDSNFHVWGHMTQIVWKDTTSVGCATVDCSSQGLANTGGNVAPFFTVCNYYPQGNVQRGYKDNVIKPRGDATCSWNDGL